MQINDNTVIGRSPDVVDTEVDGQVVLMNVNEGKYYSANSVGCKIWQLLEDPISFDGLCKRLAEIFDISKVPNYKGEVINYVVALVEKKLLVLK